jgi:hypothetical protein
MAYGHAERNLALIRQLEAETRDLLGTLEQPDPEQSAWLQDHHRSRSGRADRQAFSGNGAYGVADRGLLPPGWAAADAAVSGSPELSGRRAIGV